MHVYRYFAITVACVAAVLISACKKAQDDKLPVYGSMPVFTMQNQRGESFSAATLRGKVSIVNFMFTRCETVCPAFTMKMKGVQDRTAALGQDVQLVSISVDPEHDTPAKLATYAHRFGANPKRWSFLTGDPKLVKKTATEGLKLALSRAGDTDSGVPNIAHSERFVLVDEKLQIRGYYSSGDPASVDNLVRHVKRLIEIR